MMARTSVYMLYRLDLPLGSDRVRLFGLLAARDDAAEFVLTTPVAAGTAAPPIGSGETLPATMFPPDITMQIVDPLGLDGVTLTSLHLAGRVYREGRATTIDATTIDLAIGATAVFPGIAGLTLDAAVVIDAGTPRLAMVTLSTQRPLTLTDLLTNILDGGARWAAEVTDQFAFISGTLYWLQGDAGATFAYPREGTTLYNQGYHLDGALSVFGHALKVDVGVVKGEHPSDSVTTLSATVDRIGFDLAALKAVSLSVVNGPNDRQLAIDTRVELFGSDVAMVHADYDTGAKAFAGQVTAAIGPVSLPIVGTVAISLAVAFAWNQQGFRITQLGGLPSGLPDIVADLQRLLNVARSGGCEAVLTSWIPDLTTRLAPSLSESPSRTVDGRLNIPLAIGYTVLIGNTQLQSSSIDLPLTVELPTSIDALPGALWGAIEDNLGNVVTAMLSDTTTYQVIAIEIGKRGGAAAFAAMICRALREFLEGLAKQIAQQAVALASDAIAAVAALAGMLVAVALLGVKELLNLFEELWDKIKELFGDDDKKEEAEDRVNAYRRDVEAKIAVVTAKIAEARARMAISTLRTSLSDDGTSVIASVTWVEGRPTNDDAGNGHFTCTLDMLPGVPGTPGTPVTSVALTQDSVAIPLATLGGGNYRMNAVARPAVRDITFMDGVTAQNLATAAETLRGIDNDVARSFGGYLDGLRSSFEAMNRDGIVGDPVYATTDVPAVMTVGKSRLGFNTRLPA